MIGIIIYFSGVLFSFLMGRWVNRLDCAIEKREYLWDEALFNLVFSIFSWLGFTCWCGTLIHKIVKDKGSPPNWL